MPKSLAVVKWQKYRFLIVYQWHFLFKSSFGYCHKISFIHMSVRFLLFPSFSFSYLFIRRNRLLNRTGWTFFWKIVLDQILLFSSSINAHKKQFGQNSWKRRKKKCIGQKAIVLLCVIVNYLQWYLLSGFMQ